MVFFFNDTATTEIYTLSLHDALPICPAHPGEIADDLSDHGDEHESDNLARLVLGQHRQEQAVDPVALRSEEHTSELQSRQYLVCRLLLEKKNMRRITTSARGRHAPSG